SSRFSFRRMRIVGAGRSYRPNSGGGVEWAAEPPALSHYPSALAPCRLGPAYPVRRRTGRRGGGRRRAAGGRRGGRRAGRLVGWGGVGVGTVSSAVSEAAPRPVASDWTKGSIIVIIGPTGSRSG